MSQKNNADAAKVVPVAETPADQNPNAFDVSRTIVPTSNTPGTDNLLCNDDDDVSSMFVFFRPRIKRITRTSVFNRRTLSGLGRPQVASEEFMIRNSFQVVHGISKNPLRRRH
jgi:hypothetical protein